VATVGSILHDYDFFKEILNISSVKVFDVNV
jgi:hypothetical protein